MSHAHPPSQRVRQRARPRPRPAPKETLEPRRPSPRRAPPEERRPGDPRPGPRIPEITSDGVAGLNAIPANTQGQFSERSMLRADERSLAEIRRYAHADLYAVAELGHQYLFAGALGVAEALFDGLIAVAPNEAYFNLAMGLVRMQQGRIEDAERAYARAGALDPHDGRPDVNRAELRLQKKDFRTAKQLLRLGARKAERRGDRALQHKADALLARLQFA